MTQAIDNAIIKSQKQTQNITQIIPIACVYKRIRFDVKLLKILTNFLEFFT